MIEGLMPFKPDYQAIAKLIKEYEQLAFLLRGELINATINLEMILNEFVIEHFCGKSEKLKSRFASHILHKKLNYAYKIYLFKTIISEVHTYIRSAHPTINQDLKTIGELRNFLAHNYLNSSIENAFGKFGGSLSFADNKLGTEESKTVKEIKDTIALAEKYTAFLMDYRRT